MWTGSPPAAHIGPVLSEPPWDPRPPQGHKKRRRGFGGFGFFGVLGFLGFWAFRGLRSLGAYLSLEVWGFGSFSRGVGVLS